MHDFYQKQQEIRNAFNSVKDTYDDYSEIQQKGQLDYAGALLEKS